MPDLGQWLILLVLAAGAAVVTGWPLRRSANGVGTRPSPDADHEALELRHRVALEGLRDVEADRRAGSLDDAAYQRERADAELRAARSLADLEAGSVAAVSAPAPAAGRRAAVWVAGIIGVALLVGFALPSPVGLGQRTVVDQALADQQAAESARQAQIQRLLGQLGGDPRNPQVLSDLADAYLAGDSLRDLQRAAAALIILVSVEPRDHSAYRRLITAYLAAGDTADASAATASYAGVAGSAEPDIPFFRGLIARADGDAAQAVAQFDSFLAMAGDDPRGAMVRSLRAELESQLSSPSPG
jgi:cytochrome c-type biogenesis protein CcmH/NrfG